MPSSLNYPAGFLNGRASSLSALDTASEPITSQEKKQTSSVYQQGESPVRRKSNDQTAFNQALLRTRFNKPENIGLLVIQDLPLDVRNSARQNFFGPQLTQQVKVADSPELQRTVLKEDTPAAANIKRRMSEFDFDKREFRVHPDRSRFFCLERDIASCSDKLLNRYREAFNVILDDLKNDLDAWLTKNGVESTDGIPRDRLVKAIVPYKWIQSSAGTDSAVDPDERQLIIAKSKIPEKMGHVTLIGGKEPFGGMGGLLYLQKHLNGEYELVMDNDSGRFSCNPALLPVHLDNIALRSSQLTTKRIATNWLDMAGIQA